MTFGVIGFGRFGQLWARTLTQFGDVLVYEKESVEQREEGIAFVSLEEVADVDMLFLIVPISAIEACCKDIAPLLKSHTTVIDVCSVKVHPAKMMQEHLPQDQPLIATHPLFGPDSVGRLGMPGRKIVVSELRGPTEVLEDILHKLELKIIKCTPEEHDQQMARSQALIHFIGRGLTDLKLHPQDISTPGYEALLEMNHMVENDTWQLFFDMHQYNPFSKEMREGLLKKLQTLNNEIE